MKKILILILTLLSWQLAQADVVTVDQARRRAAQFFTAAEVQTKATAVHPDDFKLIGTFPDVATKSSSEAPAMYIFERPAGGYAIVSGDDVARPVLGYSLKGHFPVSDMPDNMRAMLQWYADIIAYAREQGWESAPDIEADSGLDPANSVQLQTAQWGQGHPFNDLVSEINGQKPPIGCVATAIAIIMRYHKWPSKGTGTLPSYDYEKNGVNYHVEGFNLGHVYDWDKMPEDYRDCSEEDAAQMARLLYDVAVMCQMSFYPGGSGASEREGARRLPEFFGYDKRVRSYERYEVYSDLQWESFISAEIDAGRPALFAGWSNGGHSFVIDGYNGRYFSINYGWSGGSTWREGHDRKGAFKDYYTLTPIDGHEEDLLSYNRSQQLTTHIMPDQNGVPEPVVRVGDAINLPFVFELGEQFHLLGSAFNQSLETFTLAFRFALYDVNGNLKEVISAETNETLEGSFNVGRSIDFPCTITKPLAEGDQILLTMRDPVSGRWAPVTQARKSMIVFTERPLSELIEIGYGEEPIMSNWEDSKTRDIYIKYYKDVPWILCREDGTKLLNNEHGVNHSSSNSEISWRMGIPDLDEPQKSDTFLYEIWLPTGTYTLRLKNPATNEQMEIKLEL